MKRLLSLTLSILLLLTLAGCGGNATPSPTTDASAEFGSGEESIRYFTVTPEGEVYAVTDTVKLGKYQMDGALIEDYGIDDDLMSLHYYDGKVYAFDMNFRIVSFDVQSKTITPITEQMGDVIGIQNLVASDGYIYMLGRLHDEQGEEHDHNDDEFVYSQGYTNHGEAILRIDLETGERETLDVKNPIALYRTQNNGIYVYSCPASYVLYSLNPEDSTLKLVANMDDVGNILAFVYENENFSYVQSSNDGKSTPLYNKRISDKKITTVQQGLYTGPGSHVQYYAGNLVMCSRELWPADVKMDGLSFEEYMTIEQGLRAGLVSVYMDDLRGEKSASKLNGNVTIYSTVPVQYLSLDFEALYTKTRIVNTMIFADDNRAELLFEESFLTDLMAGSDDIDIFILSRGPYGNLALRNMGMYVPLNDSAVIDGYLDSCFDYIRTEATAPNGDVWMLPIQTYASALWYVPENFERFGLTPEDVRYFDDLVVTLERVNNADENYTTYGYVPSYHSIFENQYNNTYNDIPNRLVDYNTDLFKKLFETLYSGWVAPSPTDTGMRGSPLIRSPGYDTFYNTQVANKAEHNLDRVIFQLRGISEHLFSWYPYDYEVLERWRALPIPRLNEDVDVNMTGGEVWQFAVINPESKNKEAAVAYLEAIAANPQTVNYNPVFMQKDIESYSPYFDISLPCFQDIYDIYSRDRGYRDFFVIIPNDGTYIDDYQRGRMTLDETVAAYQREAEMALNE